MFADSLLDSSWPRRSRRHWSTLASFAVQTVAVGSVLVFPLLYTTGLPPRPVFARIFGPSSLPALPTTSHVRAASRSASHGTPVISLTVSRTVPRDMDHGTQMSILPAPDWNRLGIPGGSDGRISGNGVEHGFSSELNAALPPPPPHSANRPPRISRIMEGNLIFRVQPEYPTIARLAHIQGAVVLQALISKEGTIENLQAVSGPPLLMKAALEAVQQWRYRPYLLNGEPVEVETQVTVNFILGGE